MDSYKSVHELRIFDRTAPGRRDLNDALAIFARNTSPLIRTQINQIQEKFENPESPTGRFYYAGFFSNDRIVGFNMFAYYPKSRVIIVDHMALEPEHRRHGSFYIFAISPSTMDFGQFARRLLRRDRGRRRSRVDHGDITGSLLVRLLRQVGFGRVHVKYYLPSNEPKIYQKKFEAALMLRGLNRVPQIRTEDLLDIVKVILFEHDLAWYRDYFGDFLPSYEAHLSEILTDIQRQVEHEPHGRRERRRLRRIGWTFADHQIRSRSSIFGFGAFRAFCRDARSRDLRVLVSWPRPRRYGFHLDHGVGLCRIGCPVRSPRTERL
ncbi:MAG: hypothetical protein WDM86_16805 [Rhizomicrobium sp.]